LCGSARVLLTHSPFSKHHTSWPYNKLMEFDVHVTVHLRHSEGKEPTMRQSMQFYCLNMFRAPIYPSSGEQLINNFCF
jgi:hypothetical protein